MGKGLEMDRAALIVLTDSTDVSSFGPPETNASVVMIGNFDGVHRGHRAVMTQATAIAKERGLVPAVLTFDPHPSSVVGGGAPPMLTTLERRAELIGRLGVERVYVRRFDSAFAAWSPERFARDLVSGLLHARVVMVGDNFHFGAKRRGDFALLATLGAALGFEARAHGVASDAAGRFSSTRARKAVANGDLAEVQAVLGRLHAISGIVVRGDQRGRTIGFPTANLDAVPEVTPPNGVYSVLVDTLSPEPRALAKGVMNVGVRPTVGGDLARTIEVNLFDYSGDLYGAKLRVHLVSRLRDEMKFAGLDALKAQIARDAEAAREAVSTIEPSGASFG